MGYYKIIHFGCEYKHFIAKMQVFQRKMEIGLLKILIHVLKHTRMKHVLMMI